MQLSESSRNDRMVLISISVKLSNYTEETRGEADFAVLPVKQRREAGQGGVTQRIKHATHDPEHSNSHITRRQNPVIR